MSRGQATVETSALTKEKREQIFDAFRRWGYLQADLDPLGDLRPMDLPELQLTGEVADAARRFYCGTVGFEFMHIADRERRRWLQERIERDAVAPDRAHILERLIRAELFEQVLQTRYLGTKRYSLEGIVALIPLLDEMLGTAAESSATECVLAVSHRGRLNVMVHTVCRSAVEIFARFEDIDPRSVLGGGDVKYHMGATGDFVTASGPVHVHLVSNPSHLEAVDPVALGRARAKQIRRGAEGTRAILPIVVHGDAAFAGQGIWAETLNGASLEGFSVGGDVHIIANNLIGFTTIPKELHSSRFSADLAKRMAIPIFHVNAEDPDAVVRVARLAVEYRYAFASPVVVDLIGFRRHGHSEVDDPTITQPLRYRKIQAHPVLWELYAKKTGADATATVQQVREEFGAAQKEAEAIEKDPVLRELPRYWDGFKGGRYNPSFEVNTGLAAGELKKISESLTNYPGGFAIHPKVKKLLEQRAEMGQGKRAVDFGMAEALAFGSLLREGVPVRLTGQDTKRGTFNQRHAALIDTETEAEYIPLCNVGSQQARFEVHNSPLSEASILGYEYGYSRDFPEALVLWEAQFGDFANGAQVIIDQFIAAGEDKWGLLTGLVLLLPHGYEGQGPEHSSARIERFLQLAARDNIQVCQPSTAAQYFHLLRRQALRKWRKPLVVFTPKSMLRNPAAASALAEFSAERFRMVVPDPEIARASRVLICTGKIGHELRAERARRKDSETAVLFLEQLYPFPEAEVAAEFERYSAAHELVWVQEEPANMGALAFVIRPLERLAGGRPVRSLKRSASASPATGSAKAHELEQKTLLELAFSTGKK
ncbi:MAG TPA: 2-oxoglutarate dehydrogenase E1 component [Candidatus Acidoferrales bacterium]|jgi:2-oxoglutarate dehydrogenase E1 component|nr:2-oxoglutarate dehydrogenase E1 component [Candidatus Acidoferrales bacterium]